MPSGKRLDLNEALEDSPQTQTILASMETSVGPFRDFVIQLKETCQTLHTQQLKVTETIGQFSRLLGSADDKLFGEKDPFSLGALRQLSKYVNELKSWQEMLCIQIDHAIVQQLDSFLSNDLARVDSLKDAFHSSKTDHDQAISKYNRVSKKKETERSRFDANSELFTARRRFHQSSMQYYAELNNLQLKKKFQVLDPMLAFMHSQLAFFKMGHEILTDEVGKFLTMLNVEIQKVRSEYEQSFKQQKAIAADLEQHSTQLCTPDPDPADPFVEYQPANLQLQSKSGYLLYRQQGSKWERVYFYTKGHLLYWQHINRAAEVLLDLTTEGVNASISDVDDRRYVFQILAVQPPQQQQQQQLARRMLFFQAESGKSRDEWIATISNIVSVNARQPAEMEDLMNFERERTDSDVIRMERERVRTFVQSHSTSRLLSPTQFALPQMAAKKSHPPPLPPRPPPPQKKRSRAPPPPPPFGGGTTEKHSVQKLLEQADESNLETDKGYMMSYLVRYLGMIEVDKDKGVRVVKEAIRRIVATRALKNIMAIHHTNIVVTHKGISLTDTKSGKVTEVFKMKDISYCACHPDNPKLFGFIARVWGNGKFISVCYVFESEKSGKEVCQSFIDAIKTAVNIVVAVKASSPTAVEETPPTLPPAREREDSIVSNQLPSTPPPSPSAVSRDDPFSFKQRGGSMPKSRSTGSFRTQLETAMRTSLPCYSDEEGEKDSGVVISQQQQDSLIDFMSEAHTYDVIDELPTPRGPSSPPQLVEDNQPLDSLPAVPSPTVNDQVPIYATVIKKPAATTPSSVTVDSDARNTSVGMNQISPAAAPHQFDTQFDSLLELQRATDIATGAGLVADNTQLPANTDSNYATDNP